MFENIEISRFGPTLFVVFLSKYFSESFPKVEMITVWPLEFYDEESVLFDESSVLPVQARTII